MLLRYRVTRTPAGEAPQSVREEWVGVILPVKELIGRCRGAGVLTGAPSPIADGVAVRGVDAIEALKAADRLDAARWWEENYKGNELLFEKSEGELLDA